MSMKTRETVNNILSVYCLKYAESVLPENMVFCGGNKEKKLPISFVVYLIKHGDRNILIDAGCDTMPGFKMRRFYSPAFVLRSVGVSSDEITDVIITHSHHDHIEGLKHFKNATVHISKAEYDGGKKFIPEGFSVNVFENECEIAENIKILEIGGHSKGSSIVELNVRDAVHIFAGDECYTDSNIRKRLCTGSFYNQENSIEFVEKYSDAEFKVHTCHDASLKTERII